MRDAFAKAIVELAARDPDVVLLTADIGNRLFDTFKERFGPRFLNCGVAEAGMTGAAAGMALCGMRPVTYTIAAFNTVRCMEQIRVDLCYHNLPVTVVGVGAGLSYAPLGYTHHATEDVGLLRLLPNMSVLCPADPSEVYGAVRAAHDHDGPVYIRLGKKGEPRIHDDVPAMKVGGSLQVRAGSDICLLACGTITQEALRAADILAANGISAEVVSFYSVKPLDQDRLREVFARFPVVATVEEHTRLGGLGAAIVDWLSEEGLPAGGFLRFALPDAIFGEAGSQDYALQRLGLTAEAIAEAAAARLGATVVCHS